MRIVKSLRIAAFCITVIIGLAFSLSSESYAESYGIYFNKDSYNVKAGESVTIYITEESADSLQWGVSDDSVAVISNSNTRSATVTGKKKGTVTISAMDWEGKEYTCPVNVTVPEMKLSISQRTIGIGSSVDISVKTGESVYWTTSNKDIVALGGDGSQNQYTFSGYPITARGVGLGTATITATSMYGATATCTITVKEEYLELETTEITFKDWDVSTGSSEIKVISGEAVSVQSSNVSVAEAFIYDYYSAGDTIYIENKKEGNCIIKVTGKDGATASINVTVKYTFDFNKKSLKIDCSYLDYWDDPGHIHSSVDERDDFSSKYDIVAKTNRVGSVRSENTSIVGVKADPDYDSYDEGTNLEWWQIEPRNAGTTNLIIERKDLGKTIKIPVTVTNKYASGYLKKKAKVVSKYGQKSVTGQTFAGAKVSVKIGGKVYSNTANSNGAFSVKIPVFKLNTPFTCTISKNGSKGSFSSKVTGSSSKASISTVYKSTKKIKVTGKKLHKGDTITIKVGKKTYKKKIKSDKSKYVYNQKITKAKAGTKITITVTNKYKQKLYSKKAKVYYASKVRKGMTKKQCRLVPSWGYPDDETVSGNITIWWYDDDNDGYAIDSYLKFKNGKLIGWG